MGNQKITIETTVNSDIDKAWKCWTEPEHVTKWNFAADTWHCPKASNDLRNQGKFSFTMAAKDGSMSFDMEGVYDQVKNHEYISYTMADGRQVEITFMSHGHTVHITESFDPENVHPPEFQKAGWQSILDNYKRYVESI